MLFRSRQEATSRLEERARATKKRGPLLARLRSLPVDLSPISAASEGRPSTMAADPFPLFHLSPLDFAVSNPAQLSSAQLALAPYSAEWDEAAEKKVIRTWRQRREKNRARMGTVGIGVYASPEERAREQWPLFELVDLAWELKGAELESLTSAQLAVRDAVQREWGRVADARGSLQVVAFHPDSTKDLVADAEDVRWYLVR